MALGGYWITIVDLATFLGAFVQYVGDRAAIPPRASPANVAPLPSRPLRSERDGAVSVLLTPCESPPLRGSVEFAGATLPPRASPARIASLPRVPLRFAKRRPPFVHLATP